MPTITRRAVSLLCAVLAPSIATAQPITFRGVQLRPGAPSWQVLPPGLPTVGEAAADFIAAAGALGLHRPAWLEALDAHGGDTMVLSPWAPGEPPTYLGYQRFAWGPGLFGDVVIGGIQPTLHRTATYMPDWPGGPTADAVVQFQFGGGTVFKFTSPLRAFGTTFLAGVNFNWGCGTVPGNSSLHFLRAGVPVFDVWGLADPCGDVESAYHFLGAMSPTPDLWFDEVLVVAPALIVTGMPYVAAVPEPATLALTAGGLLALSVTARRRRCHPSHGRPHVGRFERPRISGSGH